VAKGAVYLTIQTISEYIFSLIFYLIIARILDSSDIGKLSLLLMLNSFFSLINPSIQFALQKFIPTYVEEGRSNEIGKIIRTGLTILVSISISVLIVLLVFNAELSILIFGSTSESWPIIIMLITAFIFNLSIFFGGEMLGFGMFKELALQNILNTGVSRFLALSLTFLGFGLLGITISWMLASFLALIFALIVLRHKLQLKRGLPVKAILEYSLPIHIFTIILFIQAWADIAILYAFSPNLSQIGTYYLVVSGALILSMFYIPIGHAIFPALSGRYARNGRKGLAPMVETYIRVVSKILIPVGASFAVLSATAIEVVYGPQHVSGAIPFAMLAATSIIPSLTLLVITIIQSTGKTRPIIIIGILASITNIIVVAGFASQWGGIAGAAGRITFSMVGFIVGYYYIRSEIDLYLLSAIRKPIIVAITIAFPLYILDQYLTNIVPLTIRIRAPIEILSFFCLATLFAYLTKYFTKEDFGIIKQASPKKLERIIDKIENALIRK
jgi:O-antigen/teichoic acid export membrane protein|tara:strand:+ start:20287 stop:21789 length:1503 start_codon:yes stop_codon:yes gene_type:complete